MTEVRSTASATGANLGCGFDVISVAYDNPKGDVVTAKTSNVPGIRLTNILNTEDDLPRDNTNVVVAVAEHLLTSAKSARKEIEFAGLDLVLEKNMGIGTGMGSSASSGVASAYSVNELLGGQKFDIGSQQMIAAAIYGEYVATNGKPHGDNALAALKGGFVLIYNSATYEHKAAKAGGNFYFVVVSPSNVSINTGEARAKLDSVPYNLISLVRYSTRLVQYKNFGDDCNPIDEIVECGGLDDAVRKYLAGTSYLVQGINRQDPELLGRGMMMDDIITPVRAKLIRAPNASKGGAFQAAKEAALIAGAYGFTISGSGPAVVGVADSEEKGHLIGRNVTNVLDRSHGIIAEYYVAKVDNQGARRI
jgi:homoserine kinase